MPLGYLTELVDCFMKMQERALFPHQRHRRGNLECFCEEEHGRSCLKYLFLHLFLIQCIMHMHVQRLTEILLPRKRRSICTKGISLRLKLTRITPITGNTVSM
nr:MAG TPA: hypothetical protein [Caudoviricetes sp.]